MKLFLAYKNSATLMDGECEQLLGVFTTKEAAWQLLGQTSDFTNSQPLKNRRTGEVNPEVRAYHFDGELSYYWQVKEAELNSPLNEYSIHA